MNWDKERNVIIFDKLVSLSNDPGRKYTYAPSGGYDGFGWGELNLELPPVFIPVQILKDGEAPPEQK